MPTFDGRLHVTAVVSAPFEENTYIVRLEGRPDALVIDPGLEPGKIVAALERDRVVPAAILITHGHSDHIAGNARLKQLWPQAPLVIGRGDAVKLTDPQQNLSAQYGFSLISPAADVLLDEGDTYEAAGIALEVREIPGHSSGHVVFVWKSGQPWVVFGGDVLFAGSIGRTDFPDGDFEQLATGIHGKLFSLPDETVVLSGHGEATTIGQEKRTNQFVGKPAGWQPR